MNDLKHYVNVSLKSNCDILTDQNVSFDFEYNNETLIGELLEEFNKYITDSESYLFKDDDKPYFVGFYYDYGRLDPNIKLENLVTFLQAKENGLHILILAGIGDAIECFNGIKIYTHPNENAHTPHVHAQYQGKSISIDLYTFEVKGTFDNKKKQRTAVDYARDNQEMLVKYYCARTNGIAIDYLEVIDNDL